MSDKITQNEYIIVKRKGHKVTYPCLVGFRRITLFSRDRPI